MNKKILLSLFLVLIVALSVSAVSAEDDNELPLTDFDGNTVNSPQTITVETDDADGIQAAIDRANDGDTISFRNTTYEIGSQTFQFPKSVTVLGNGATIQTGGAGQGGQGATFMAAANNTSFIGFNFVNTDGPKNYGDKISGYAIQLAIGYGTVDSCTFLDFASGVYGRGAAFCTISNCYFNGSATKVTNGGTKESGTKGINLMGSHDIKAINNTFEGQLLDGISIASNSGNNIMTGNTFIDNCYAIYFGGASTQGCVIANNTFIRCGYAKDENGTVIFKDLPIISTQKAANGYILEDNTFNVTDGAIILKAESGNTAHGYPSSIGDINITGNTIQKDGGNVNDSVNATFIYLYSNEGLLTPYAPIKITNNTYAPGVTPVTVWYADWNDEDGVIIPAAEKTTSTIVIKDVSTADNKVNIALTDVNGAEIANAEINYTINDGEEVTVTTDENGLATIDMTEDGVLKLKYYGDDTYKDSETQLSFTSTATEKKSSVIDYQNMTTQTVATVDGRVGEMFRVVLKDSEGHLLTGKAIQIGFNGKVYNRVTDENGAAELQINLGKAGGYTFAICFLGDDEYNASFAVAKITVVPQTLKVTVPAKTYKASAKTKTLTATVLSNKGGKIAGITVTFKVNGKTYTAKTDAKGVAKVNVSLTAKKTYSFTVSYAGGDKYAKFTKTSKVTIN